MTDIDFPDSPSEDETVAGGSRVWQYAAGRWVLIKYQAADGGSVDAGLPDSDTPVRINGGIPESTFLLPKTIDGGTI